MQSLHAALLVSSGDDKAHGNYLAVACPNADTNEQYDRYGYLVAFDAEGLAAALVKIDLQVRGDRGERPTGLVRTCANKDKEWGQRGRCSVQRMTSARGWFGDFSSRRRDSIPCLHTHDNVARTTKYAQEVDGSEETQTATGGFEVELLRDG